MTNEEKKSIGQGLKIKAIIVLLIFLGFGIGWEIGIRAYFYYIRPYFGGMAYRNAVDAYIQAQINDFIGGNTPEETVDLFIASLKKGDYEMASKYFIIDEQEKRKKMFNEATKQQNEDWATELENKKKLWHKEVQAEDRVEFWYNTGTGEDERTHSIVLRKNINNKWKFGAF